MVQFACFFTFIEANVAIWGKKKNLVIIKLARIIHSERDTTSFLSPLLLPLISVHSGVFLRWLSLPHPLAMEDFAVYL